MPFAVVLQCFEPEPLAEGRKVPLVYGASTAIRARKVKNVNISPAGHLPFAEVEMA